MRNLGPKSKAWLGEVGILTIEDLRAIGAVEAFLRVRFQFGGHVSRNLLHAMAASILDIDWRDLSAEHKADLDRLVALQAPESSKKV